MRFRIFLVIAVLLSLSAAVKLAAAAHNSAHADIVNAKGAKIGTAKLTDIGHGVKIEVKISELSPGEHGIHIHTVGKCEAPGFTSAGGHFNPTNTHHGAQQHTGTSPPSWRSFESRGGQEGQRQTQLHRRWRHAR